MLTRTEKHALLCLTIVVIILFLLHMSIMTLLPDRGAVTYTKDTPDGTLVVHTGIINEMTLTKTGGHLIMNVSGTDVFIPNGGTKLTHLKGDKVKVIGTLETYSGKKEIVVTDISDVVLL